MLFIELEESLAADRAICKVEAKLKEMKDGQNCVYRQTNGRADGQPDSSISPTPDNFVVGYK